MSRLSGDDEHDDLHEGSDHESKESILAFPSMEYNGPGWPGSYWLSRIQTMSPKDILQLRIRVQESQSEAKAIRERVAKCRREWAEMGRQSTILAKVLDEVLVAQRRLEEPEALLRAFEYQKATTSNRESTTSFTAAATTVSTVIRDPSAGSSPAHQQHFQFRNGLYDSKSGLFTPDPLYDPLSDPVYLAERQRAREATRACNAMWGVFMAYRGPIRGRVPISSFPSSSAASSCSSAASSPGFVTMSSSSSSSTSSDFPSTLTRPFLFDPLHEGIIEFFVKYLKWSRSTASIMVMYVPTICEGSILRFGGGKMSIEYVDSATIESDSRGCTEAWALDVRPEMIAPAEDQTTTWVRLPNMPRAYHRSCVIQMSRGDTIACRLWNMAKPSHSCRDGRDDIDVVIGGGEREDTGMAEQGPRSNLIIVNGYDNSTCLFDTGTMQWRVIPRDDIVGASKMMPEEWVRDHLMSSSTVANLYTPSKMCLGHGMAHLREFPRPFGGIIVSPKDISVVRCDGHVYAIPFDVSKQRVQRLDIDGKWVDCGALYSPLLAAPRAFSSYFCVSEHYSVVALPPHLLPASVFVDTKYSCVAFFGDSGRYLSGSSDIVFFDPVRGTWTIPDPPFRLPFFIHRYKERPSVCVVDRRLFVEISQTTTACFVGDGSDRDASGMVDTGVLSMYVSDDGRLGGPNGSWKRVAETPPNTHWKDATLVSSVM